MLTERHLEIFIALAEEEHFGAAAQRVGITQPPLSQGLRRLEALLGVRLFERERGVFLTEEGALLLPHARRALAALAELRETGAREHADGRRLRLGLAPEVPAPLAADVAAAPVRAGDRTRISTVTAPTAALLSDVASGRLDLAVVRHPSVLHGLAAGQVILLPTWILAPPARRTPVERRRGGCRWQCAPGVRRPPPMTCSSTRWRAGAAAWRRWWSRTSGPGWRWWRRARPYWSPRTRG